MSLCRFCGTEVQPNEQSKSSAYRSIHRHCWASYCRSRDHLKKERLKGPDLEATSERREQMQRLQNAEPASEGQNFVRDDLVALQKTEPASETVQSTPDSAGKLEQPDDSRQCPNCGATIAGPIERYCYNCGKFLGVRCRNCGTMCDDGAFCGECGTRLEATKQESRFLQPALEAARMVPENASFE